MQTPSVMTKRTSKRRAEQTPVLVPKPLHARFKGWSKSKGLKLGWATSAAIEQFMSEGGAK